MLYKSLIDIRIRCCMVIIQAAAYKRLITAVIWVYPDWLYDPLPSDGDLTTVHTVKLAIGHYSNVNREIGNCVCGVSSISNPYCTYIAVR